VESISWRGLDEISRATGLSWQCSRAALARVRTPLQLSPRAFLSSPPRVVTAQPTPPLERKAAHEPPLSTYARSSGRRAGHTTEGTNTAAPGAHACAADERERCQTASSRGVSWRHAERRTGTRPHPIWIVT
jgi:hypothetical protein